MSNPWEAVPLDTYETHMKSDGVGQLQALSEIMKCQFARHTPKTVCVLGVAGGNGLEHIDLACTKRIYGIDVSEAYLSTCRQRFASLGDRLSLIRMDLCDEVSQIPQVDLIIADLLIEYIGIETFTRLVDAAGAAGVCCAVQQNCGVSFVSSSPCAQALQSIGTLHQDIDPQALAAAMLRIGYNEMFREEVLLPGGKKLICIDFMR